MKWVISEMVEPFEVNITLGNRRICCFILEPIHLNCIFVEMYSIGKFSTKLIHPGWSIEAFSLLSLVVVKAVAI